MGGRGKEGKKRNHYLGPKNRMEYPTHCELTDSDMIGVWNPFVWPFQDTTPSSCSLGPAESVPVRQNPLRPDLLNLWCIDYIQLNNCVLNIRWKSYSEVSNHPSSFCWTIKRCSLYGILHVFES